MVLASHGIIWVEGIPLDGCPQLLYPQGVSYLPPASPEDSPRSASGSVPDLFQNTASLCWDLEHVIFFQCRLRTVSVSYSPPALLHIGSSDFPSWMFWGLFLLMQDPWAGGLRLIPSSLGRTSTIVIFLLFVDHSPWGFKPQLYHVSAPLTCLVVPSFFL